MSNDEHLTWFDSSVRRAIQMNCDGRDFNLPVCDCKNRTLKPNTSQYAIQCNFINTLDDTCLCRAVDDSKYISHIEILPGMSDYDNVFLEFNIAPQIL